MSCIIWMLLEANNVWGNCLEYWQLRSALSGGLMVCIYLWQCTSHDPFFFLRECVTSFPFCFLALGLVTLCFCSCRRCCPDRPVVFSRTLSSTKITRAVRMSWTSSSMVESSSSLFFWTPWVNYTSTQHLDSLASLEKPFYWWCKLKFKRGTGQWLVGESHRDVCIKRTLFFLLCCESFCRWSKNSVENSLCLSACFVWDDINWELGQHALIFKVYYTV